MRRQINDQKVFFREWSKRTGISQRDLKIIYSEFINIVKDSATDADHTKTIIPDIGILEVKPEEMRKRRNPKTNEILVTDPTKRSHMRLYPRFKDFIRKN